MMTRARVGLLATMLLGTLYALAAAIAGSQTDFTVGVLVACAAVCGNGIADWVCERRRERDVMRTYRQAVWARRQR